MSRWTLDGGDGCLVMRCVNACGWESALSWNDDEDELDRRISEHLLKCPKVCGFRWGPPCADWYHECRQAQGHEVTHRCETCGTDSEPYIPVHQRGSTQEEQ